MDEQDEAFEDALGDFARLLGAFFGLCCFFWFAFEFRGAFPSCPGPYDERALFASSSALGLLAPLQVGGLALDTGTTWIASFLAILLCSLLVAAFRFKRSVVLRVVTCFLLFNWLFLGCLCGAVTRI